MNRASRYLANVTFFEFVRVVVVAFCVCICHHATLSDGKIFERCELAQVLRYGHGLDVNDVANWVCIAQHSSSLNTSAFGGTARSGSHGIFQISDQFWCSPPGKGVACGIACDRLRDDDIGDDLACAKVIYAEHQVLSGDGFNAWVAYQTFCRDNPYEYVEDCFGKEEMEYLHSKSVAANSVEEEEEDNDPRNRGKVYERCELARELFLKHKIPMKEIPTWVCIAQHESKYDTSAVGRLNADGSADHGLFQISDLYWCSHKGGRRKACRVSCNKLLDSDITDDVRCVKQIYKDHMKISGDGFNAWTVYNAYCDGNTEDYVRGCFDGIDVDDSNALEELQKSSNVNKGGKQKPRGKIYEACELADELRTKHRLPEEQIATWVCIARHESEFNTSAIGYGDHGLFQISDIFWCSPPGKGKACGLSCADLEDSDISDDVQCIQKVYKEHDKLTGDGFNAWTVYPLFCSEGRSENYISHCPGKHPRPGVTSPPPKYSKLGSFNALQDFNPQKSGKVYERCELAKELLTKHDMSMHEIPTWVCIAHHESNFDTSAIGRLNTDGSADHGLFQISDLYWCSHKEGRKKACGLSCNKLLDNDITDDVGCIKKIHNEHTRISGDGFTAWTVYTPYCKERAEEYIQGCFDGMAPVENFRPTARTIDIGYRPKNKPKGKVYEECELANELRDRHGIPRDEISTWVCIAKHQSELNTSSSVGSFHGMFHISDEFWCSPPGKGKVCELHCSDLEDNDISDDVECTKKIYLEHQRLFGNGFSAWVVYPQHCSNGRADAYVGHCPGFKSSTTNAISFGSQQNRIEVHSPISSNKPVYTHEFSENPFLRHFELVDSKAASTLHKGPTQQSFTSSSVVEENVSSSGEYHLNPFLKHLNSGTGVPAFVQTKTTAIPFRTTTSSPAFFHIPIAPTPTRSNRLGTYQPKNEEQGKYEAFKAFVTPSLPQATQTPRANRLQSYQLNTFKGFKTFATPSLPGPTIQVPVTNRLQPYQLQTFNAFKSFSTPTTQPFSTRLPSLKPFVLPTLPALQFKSSTKPFISFTTRTPLTFASRDSGRYDSGKYNPEQYGSGRYDPKKYNPPKYESSSKLRIDSKSVVQISGQFPSATRTLQSQVPPSIRISSTFPQLGEPFFSSTPSPTIVPRLPSASTNLARFETFKPFTTQFDPFRPYSPLNVKPTISVRPAQFQTYQIGKSLTNKPLSIGTNVFSSPTLATPILPTKSSLQFGIGTMRTTTKTKYDPFRPFGTSFATYNPYDVFNTRSQNTSPPFSFLSLNSAPNVELEFESSNNLKRETETLETSLQSSFPLNATADLSTSLITKRETKVIDSPTSAEILPSSSESSLSTSTTESNEDEIVTPTSTTTSTLSLPTSKPTSSRSTEKPSSATTLKSSSEISPTTTEPSLGTSEESEPEVIATTTSATLVTSSKPKSTEKSRATVSSKPIATTKRVTTVTTKKPRILSKYVSTRKPTFTFVRKSKTASRLSTTARPVKPVVRSTTVAKPITSSTTRSPVIYTTPRSLPSSKSLSPTRTTKSTTKKPTLNASSQPTRLVTTTSTTSSTELFSSTRTSTTTTEKPTFSTISRSTTPATTSSTTSKSTTIEEPTVDATTSSASVSATTEEPTPDASSEPVTTSSTATEEPTLDVSSQPTTPETTTSVTTSPTSSAASTKKSTTPSSRSRATIRTAATSTTPRPSIVPTRIMSTSQKSVTPTTRTTPTRATTSLISPTKSHRSESLFSTNLNNFDLYYKLYGIHLPSKTSSNSQQGTKTTQTNVIPTRTS